MTRRETSSSTSSSRSISRFVFVSHRDALPTFFVSLSLSLWYRCPSASLLGSRVGFEERKNCEGPTRLIVLLSVFYVRVLTMPSIFHELQCYIITSLSLSLSCLNFFVRHDFSRFRGGFLFFHGFAFALLHRYFFCFLYDDVFTGS